MEYSQKYTLVAFLAPTGAGTEFTMADWPLHVTLADVFAITLNAAVEQVLTDVLAKQSPVRLTAGEYTTLGTTKVTLLNKSSELQNLHDTVVDVLEQNDATFNTPEFTRTGFLPHSTVQKTGGLKAGDEFTITAVSLVDMFPGGDWQQRKVLRNFTLGTTVQFESFFQNDEFTITRMAEADVPEAVQLINHAFAYQDAAKGEPRTSERVLQKQMAKQMFYVWRDVNGTFAATVYIIPGDHTVHFGLLAVADKFRGKGLAPAIIAAVEAYARASKAHTLELDYISIASWLENYYKKYGFAKTGVSEDIGWCKLVQMHKSLPCN